MQQPSEESGLKLGRIFGIPIYLHTTWLIIFALITYTLATQFKSQHPGWTQTQFWVLGDRKSVV